MGQWIQIDFLEETPIKGITTQGAGTQEQWVTEYQVAVGNIEGALEPIMESGSIKVGTEVYAVVLANVMEHY